MYCALSIKFINLLKIYTVGVARSLFRSLLLDTVIVNVHIYTVHLWLVGKRVVDFL